MFKRRNIYLLVVVWLLLVGCGNKEVNNLSKDNVVQKTNNEQDIEITDQNQKDASNVVKTFITEVYSNNDFSEKQNIKGIGYLANDEKWREGLIEELKYITKNGKKRFEIEKVVLKEVIEVDNFLNDENYDQSFIVNSKIIFKDGKIKKGYEYTGNVVSHNKKSNKWEIAWYNFPQFLTLYSYNSPKVIPKNEDEEQVVELAKKLIKGFLSFNSRTSVDDTEGLENLWIEIEKEDFKEDLLKTNKSIMNSYSKEKFPKVNTVEPIEIQKFIQMPLKNATDAYSITSNIIYDPNRESLDLFSANVIIAKIEGEWKVIQFNPERVAPWEYINRRTK